MTWARVAAAALLAVAAAPAAAVESDPLPVPKGGARAPWRPTTRA